MSQHAAEGIKHVTDALSIMTVIGTLAQVLPALAAIFSIVWSCFRIYETKTVQSWLKKGKRNEKTDN